MQQDINKDYFLWESFKRGDDKAFFNLYDQYVDILLGFGLHFSRDIDLIKDCIHDLFLDFYKYRKQLSGTDNIKFYMFRSLKRKIQKELSKKSIFSSEEEGKYAFLELEPAYDDVIIKTEIKEENSELLRVAMSNLTNQQREALFLKFEQDLGYPEIAQIQNISVESARTNIYRAIKALRKSIQKAKISLQALIIFLQRTRI